MICKKCGKEFTNDVKYCSECGAIQNDEECNFDPRTDDERKKDDANMLANSVLDEIHHT
jgi:predicted amidophosphoribosyltransferase